MRKRKDIFHIGETEAMVIIKNEIWTIPCDYNFLLAIDIRTGRTRFVKQVPEESNRRLFSSLIYHKEKIYCIPMSAKKIWIYDMKNEDFQSISLDLPDDYKGKTNYKENYKFSSGLLFKEKVYLISCSFPAMLMLNPETKKLTYYTEWVSEIDERVIEPSEIYFRSFYLENNHIYLPMCNGGSLLKYDLDYMTYTVLDFKKKQFSNTIVLGNKLYLSSKIKDELIVINDTSEDVIVTGNKKNVTSEMYNFGNDVLLLMENVESSYILKLSNLQTTKLNVKTDAIMGAVVDNNYIYYIGYCNKELVKIDIQNKYRIEYIPIKIDSETHNMISNAYVKKVIYEPELQLSDYLEIVLNNSNTEK